MNLKLAIDPTYSVWVSASAGTGKTKILIDRIINLLLNKVSPNRILCLTFTKSAANEMLERINSELLKWTILKEEELVLKLKVFNEHPNDELIKFARSLFILINEGSNNLKIQTIHSFSQNLLQKFPFESQISTNFTIMDERKQQEMLQKTKKQIWEGSQNDELLNLSIEYLAVSFHETILEELINTIINLRLKIDEVLSCDFKQVEKNILKFLEIKEDWNFEQEFKQIVSDIDINENDLNLIEEGGKSDKEFVENFRIWINYDFNEKLQNFNLLIQNFFTKVGKPLQKIISVKISNNYPEIEIKLNKLQDKLDKLLDNKKSLEIFYRTKYCLYFSKILLEKYNIAKQEKNYFDYNDLIILTKNLLSNPEVRDWVLFKIDESIEHVLIDEAQDTSPTQWEIINYIVEEFFAGIGASEVTRTLFVVGDDKQSIYSFQGSDPYLFDYYAQFYEKKALLSKNNFYKLNLNISYRSTEPILKLVNKFLNHKTIKDNFLHEFDKIKHNLARLGSNGSIELWPLVKNNDSQEIESWPIPENYINDEKSYSKLAHIIAMRIKGLLDKKIILESQNRPIEPKDIMILVRTRNYLTNQIISKLKEFSVPVAGIDRYNLRANLAILDLLAIGNFVYLPEDDLNLACLLKSPLFNLSEEDLFELSYQRTGSIWDNLSINPKFNEVYNYLNNLSNLRTLSPYSFYHQIIEIQKVRNSFIFILGEEVNDALNEFLAIALSYEEENIPTLYNFIVWFEKGQEEVKREINNSQNMVRIMTVHASKGLQAPIVFLPDTTSMPLKDYDFYFINEELCIFPGKVGQYNKKCLKLKDELDFNLYKEYLRLLYVAITRASDHLIITGYAQSKSIDDRSWYSIIKSSFLDIEEIQEIEFEETVRDYFEQSNYCLVKTNYAYENNYQEIETENYDEIILNNEPYQGDLMSYLKLSPSNAKNKSSHPLDTEQDQLFRGRLIHNLLEILPNYAPDQHEYIANQLIKYHEKSFIINDKKIIVEKILNLLKNDQLKELFSADHKREVSLSGEINDNGKIALIRGKIDLLCITESEVKIIDFKSDLRVPKTVDEIPLEYLKQIYLYYEVIKEIYPNKKIICLLFWIEKHLLMEINNSSFEKFNSWEFIINV